LRKCGNNESKGKPVAWQIGKVIHSYFPCIQDKLSGLVDPRKRKEYTLAELVMGGIMLFVFKEGSRNAFDNDRKESVFRRNYQRAFQMQLPSILRWLTFIRYKSCQILLILVLLLAFYHPSILERLTL
jgi:hypothetical protein